VGVWRFLGGGRPGGVSHPLIVAGIVLHGTAQV
jgi:hypothetical protein